ncbi:hypothetical protein KR026_007951 [Drosophila bipectinata]|nr:hypothetical protein KR026_007951 [Drosophila bipectinata]
MAPCVLCRSYVKDELIFGAVKEHENMWMHTNCLYLSSNLKQCGSEDQGILCFMPDDIVAEAERCRSLICYYCHEPGANIGCCQPACRRTFHTKCGYDNMTQSEFRGTFKSYCHQHVRSYRYRPAPDEDCVICQDRLAGSEERFNVSTMLHSPCCRNGWYHRHCLQSYANSAGYFFKCPLCNNNTVFNDVALRGISVPNSDASWESDPNAYVEQTQRDQMCTADRCICGTRYGFAESLMYCILCGANPAHPFCSSQDENTYTCKVCSPVSEGIQVADDPEDQVEDQESQDEQDGHDNARDEDYVPEAEDAEDTEEDEKKQPNKQEAMEESDSDDDRIMLLAYSNSVGRRHVRRSNSPSTSQTPSYNLRSLSNQENAPPTAVLRRSQRRSLTVFLPAATELAPSDEENKEDKPAPEDPLATPRQFLRSLSPVAAATRSSARIQNRRQPLLTQADSNDAASTSAGARARRFTTTGASSSLNDLAPPNLDISCVANRTRRRLPFYRGRRR